MHSDRSCQTTAHGNIYVVYANSTNADGTGGFSTVVEYSPSGAILARFDVLGKSDGLKYNRFDHKLWALRNEDANPALTLIVSALSEVSVFRSDDLSLNGQTVNVAFEVERGGDISKEIEVSYVVKDLASEKNDDRQFTGSVKIPAGKSGAEFRVPIATIREILEDGATQEATVILQGGKGYSVAAPGATSIKLADFGG